MWIPPFYDKTGKSIPQGMLEAIVSFCSKEKKDIVYPKITLHFKDKEELSEQIYITEFTIYAN